MAEVQSAETYTPQTVTLPMPLFKRMRYREEDGIGVYDLEFIVPSEGPFHIEFEGSAEAMHRLPENMLVARENFKRGEM